jgi:pimeloyl-ACP methyl ester carboxylesterase
VDAVEIDGRRIAYERVGRGPPLVLLHGYVGDGRTTWRPQLEALAEDFTLVAWDAPGAGSSADPPETWGMAGYADCLARFIDALGLRGAHIAGLSFGGALALELHRRHPGVAATLTLVSAYAGWAGSLPAEEARGRLRQARALAELPAQEFVDTLLPSMFCDATPAETVERFGASMFAVHPTGFRAMAAASAEDLRPALPGVDVPTLLVYGDQDVRAPLGVARALHHAIAGSELVVLPGVGHVCNLEAASRFNDALRSFLLRH